MAPNAEYAEQSCIAGKKAFIVLEAIYDGL